MSGNALANTNTRYQPYEGQNLYIPAEGRRVVRQRKVSAKIASVTDADRRNAATARLEALETDHDNAPAFHDSDEEFVLEESDEGNRASCSLREARDICFDCTICYADEPQLGKSRGRKRSKLTRTRKTRGMLADQHKGPKSFAAMLEEVSSIRVLKLYSASTGHYCWFAG